MPLNEREICSRWPAASTTSGSQAMDIHHKEKCALRRTPKIGLPCRTHAVPLKRGGAAFSVIGNSAVITAARNARGSSTCDDDAKPNVPESTHSKRARHNNPGRGHNTVDRQPLRKPRQHSRSSRKCRSYRIKLPEVTLVFS